MPQLVPLFLRQEFICNAVHNIPLSVDTENITLACVGLLFIIVVFAMINTLFLKVQRLQFPTVRNARSRSKNPKHIKLYVSRTANGVHVVWDRYSQINNNAFLTVLTDRPGCLVDNSFNYYVLANGSCVWGFIMDASLARAGHAFYISRIKLNLKHVDLHVIEGGFRECPIDHKHIEVTMYISPYS